MRNAAHGSVQRLRIEYSDQNDEFASLLPRSGVLGRSYTDNYQHSGWRLLVLDVPFEFQLTLGDPAGFRLLHIGHFLLRSRWVGHAIGATEPAAVHILLVDDDQMPVHDPFNLDAFVHIAWGTAVVEA